MERSIQIGQLVETAQKVQRTLEALTKEFQAFHETLMQGSDELDDLLRTMDCVELGVSGSGVIKGTLQQVTDSAVLIKTSGDSSEEVIVYRHAISYIRKTDEGSKDHRGMYV